MNKVLHTHYSSLSPRRTEPECLVSLTGLLFPCISMMFPAETQTNLGGCSVRGEGTSSTPPIDADANTSLLWRSKAVGVVVGGLSELRIVFYPMPDAEISTPPGCIESVTCAMVLGTEPPFKTAS